MDKIPRIRYNDDTVRLGEVLVVKNAVVLLEGKSLYPVRVSRSSGRRADKLHMHGFIQIFCLKDGSCIHDIFGAPQKLRPGEISIAPPFNAHRVDGRADDYEMLGMDAHCDFFKLSKQFKPWNFYDSCISPLCGTVNEKGHVFKPGKNVNDEVFRLYGDLKELSAEEDSENLPLLRGKTIELMSLVATEYSVRERELIGNRAAGNCAPMHEVFKFVHTNFRNEISAEMIAKEAMISERSLYRLFEESMNMSVHQYIQYLRLVHAKELLRNTDRTIRDIANDSGFEYLANFHRFFKSRAGISPSEYRDKFRI